MNPFTSNSEEQLLTLLSEGGEQVINFWVQEREGEDVVYYSSFETGQYVFKRATMENLEGESSDTLLEEYEVYNVTPDPSDVNRLLLDGLYLPNNTYRFGSIDVSLSNTEDIQTSFQVKEGLTGRITTLMIMPDF